MEEAPTRASRGTLAVLVALVVLSPWPFGSAHPLVAQAIAVVALLTSLAAFAFRPNPMELPPRVVLPLLGLWLLGAFQLVPLPRALARFLAPGSAALWYPSDPVAATVLRGGFHPISVDPEATARWLAFVTGLVALALLAAPAFRQRRAALHASFAVVIGALAVAFYALVARLAFGDKLYGFLAVPTIAPFGPFVSKNHFAGYVEIAACLAVGLAAGIADESRRGPERLSWLEGPHACRVVFAWGAAAVLVLAVPVSLSRGGVVSLAAGLVVLAAVRLWMRRPGRTTGRTLVFAVMALVAVALAVALVLPSEATARVRTLAGITTENSGSYRIAIGGDSLRLAAASPLVGSGLGAYEDAIPRFKTVAGDLRVEHAEDDYVEFLAEGGLAAVLLAGWLAIAAITGGLGRIRDEPHRLSRGLRVGALAGVAALLVHSAFDFNLHIPSNALLVVLLAAFALAPIGRVANGTAPEREARRGYTRLLGGAVLAVATVLAFATPWTGRRLDSAQFLRTAGGDAVGLRWQSLERDTIAHLRRRPADATAWVGLGWLRRPRSQAEATALAGWGVGLDPQFEALRHAAERVTSVPGTQQRAP
jgi:hypothetical protein